MSKKATSGIYLIFCIGNGKFYIGSAVNVTGRWNYHKWQLRKGTHCNPYLQNSWKKYGEEMFVHAVLEPVPEEKLRLREQWWLDESKACDPRHGFNIYPAESQYQRPPTAICPLRKWLITDPHGREYETTSLSKFCRTHALDASVMHAIANAANKSHRGGWHARYAEESMQEWWARWNGRSRYRGDYRKKYECTSPQGERFVTDDLPKFAGEHGLSAISMRSIANNRKQKNPLKHGWTKHRGWSCTKETV